MELSTSLEKEKEERIGRKRDLIKRGRNEVAATSRFGRMRDLIKRGRSDVAAETCLVREAETRRNKNI